MFGGDIDGGIPAGMILESIGENRGEDRIALTGYDEFLSADE
jgi:hypothetical protein